MFCFFPKWVELRPTRSRGDLYFRSPVVCILRFFFRSFLGSFFINSTRCSSNVLRRGGDGRIHRKKPSLMFTKFIYIFTYKYHFSL